MVAIKDAMAVLLSINNKSSDLCQLHSVRLGTLSYLKRKTL
jgi:hypothetical protein